MELCSDVEVWSSGDLEACCKRAEYRALEARCRSADVGTEIWKRVAGVQTWRYGGLEVWGAP